MPNQTSTNAPSVDTTFTMGNVSRVAQAIASMLIDKGGKQRVAVGFDARPNGRDFAIRVVEVLAANGIPADLIDQVTPTPIMAEATRPGQMHTLAIHVTASHNPVYSALDPDVAWQGIKVLENGLPGGDALTAEIARRANDSSVNGTFKWIPYNKLPANLTAKHINLIASSNQRLRNAFIFPALQQKIIDYKKTHPDFGIVIDSMHGATSEAAKIFQELGVVDEHFNTTPINQGDLPKTVKNPKTGKDIIWAPDPTNPPFHSEFTQAMKPGKLGLLLDGDGDRAVVKDIDGATTLSPNDLGLAFAAYLHMHRLEGGRIVRTLPTTRLLDRLARFFRTRLGEDFPVGSVKTQLLFCG